MVMGSMACMQHGVAQLINVTVTVRACVLAQDVEGQVVGACHSVGAGILLDREHTL